MQASTFDDQRTGFSIIARNTLYAVITVLVLNLVVYFVSDAVGWIPETLPERAEAFGLVTVILYSIIPLLLGGVLLTLLCRWTNHPVIMFALIAAVVFIASLVAPLTLAGTATSFKMVLVAMHVITAVVGSAILLWRVADETE
jgi:uncharacterized membrane protein YeaQ/YmgE (transglycosylase-associated protein family)